MGLAPERLRLQDLMRRTTDDQARSGNWRYAAIRPQVIPAVYSGAGVHVYADCSDGARMLAKWAGVKDDPAGNGYASWGNSSSIWAHLHHVPLIDAQPGDIGTFGKWSGEEHALMFWQKYGTGPYDWFVWNHGRPGQPARKTLMEEIAGHSGMTLSVCRLNVADPPPTPEDKLRAKTGFYAWVAWRLSEGPWRKYKRCDPRVRPDVPRVIYAKWWLAYASFLRNRRHGNP